MSLGVGVPTHLLAALVLHCVLGVMGGGGKPGQLVDVCLAYMDSLSHVRLPMVRLQVSPSRTVLCALLHDAQPSTCCWLLGPRPFVFSPWFGGLLVQSLGSNEKAFANEFVHAAHLVSCLLRQSVKFARSRHSFFRAPVAFKPRRGELLLVRFFVRIFMFLTVFQDFLQRSPDIDPGRLHALSHDSCAQCQKQ